ncbi:hypothetical protein FQR65_LT20856 [Abscondita terminalis]|nr:hypothetical protein FQR65_LT20856 [Abscondita terminalis]
MIPKEWWTQSAGEWPTRWHILHLGRWSASLTLHRNHPVPMNFFSHEVVYGVKPKQEGARGREVQQQRHQDGADGVDVLDRIERDAPHHGRSVVAEIAGGIAMGGLVHRDREEHGQGIDEYGLYEVGEVHGRHCLRRSTALPIRAAEACFRASSRGFRQALDQIQPQRIEAAPPLAHDSGRVAHGHGHEVDHRGRLRGAGAGIDHGIQVVGKALDDLVGVMQGLGLARGNQRGGDQRLAQLLQQQLRALAVGHAQADGLARRMAQALGHFLGGFQDEGVGPWRGQLEQAVLAVVHARIAGQLGQVATQQREVVLVVDLADAAQPLHRRAVVQVADQGIARIGGDGQNGALAQHLGGLFDQAGLGIIGVGFEA